jgi:glycosyltransferase involved in cell wall biosynthesis
MRIAFLAAGAGDMYCGSCLLDNRLAATLITQGQDVILFPLYAPIRTDEGDTDRRAIHYGGINVYLQQRSGAYRRLPRLLTRVLDTPRLLRWASRLAGRTRGEDLGALTVSVLEGHNGAHRRELDRLIDTLSTAKPELVHLPNLMFAGLAEPLKEALGVPVLCTLSGEDIFLDALPSDHRAQAFELIRRGSHHIDGLTAVTAYYAQRATERFGLKADRVHTVPLGVRTDDVGNPADPPPKPFTIGYLARVCPEKGLAHLCEALLRLREAGRACRLRAAGWLGSADRPYLDGIVRRLTQAGAAEAFEYVGELDRPGKIAFLKSLHVLSVPTVYQEAKGLYVLEAMACGVPVVQPHHGAFPEIVGATGGGLLYDTADAAALADTLAGLMDDPARRRRLGAQGRSAVFESYTDAVMAQRMALLYQKYTGAGPVS